MKYELHSIVIIIIDISGMRLAEDILVMKFAKLI